MIALWAKNDFSIKTKDCRRHVGFSFCLNYILVIEKIRSKYKEFSLDTEVLKLVSILS